MSARLPLTPGQVDVEFKLLNAAYSRLRLDAWMTTVSIIAFGSLMWPLFPKVPMSIWIVAFGLNVASSFGLAASFNRRRSQSTEPLLRFWQGGLIVHLSFAGLCWTVGPVLMMSHATGPYVALFASILLVSCAVATISMAEQQWALRFYLVTALLPSAAAALWTGGSGMALVAGVLVTGAAAMAVVGRGSGHATRALVQTEVRLQAALTLAGAVREEAELAREEAELAREEAELARADAEQACMQAEAASAAKTRFLATMSHELRTPLNAVIGGAELLRIEQASGSARTAERIDSIQRSGTHLLGLIENILDLSRIEHGEMPLHLQDFDVVDCLQGALSTAAVLAQVKGLSVRLDVTPGLPTWRCGDAQRLRQVVLNLLGNAVKFTLQGEVSLRIEAAPGKPLTSAVPSAPSNANDWLHISVMDSGVGISEAALPHVFDPFHQADQSSNRRFGGSGLGLAIVKLWVETMGGQVSVQSRLGEGACFTVALPLPLAEWAAVSTQKPALVSPRAPSHTSPLISTSTVTEPQWRGAVASTFAPTTAVAARSAPYQSHHILVVEDDEINQAVVCGLLKHAGHRVSSALNGAQALAAMTGANTVELVLMDWQMPDMDGLEVTRRLRAGQAGLAGRRVPIVALTANAFAEDRAACLAAGMNDFLSKPVLSADLLAAVARAADSPPTSVLGESAGLVVAAAVPASPVVGVGAKPTELKKTTEGTVQLYDPTVLAALPMVIDGSAPEYAQELLDLFMVSTAASLRALQVAALAADNSLMQRLLHTLKSSSASVGALRLSALAAAGEATLKRGETPAAHTHAALMSGFQEFETVARAQVQA